MALQINKIHHGDCVELLGQAKPGTVDLVFADPPFNIGYKYDVYDDRQAAEDYLDWCRKWISGVHRVLKSDGTFWLAIGDEFAAELKIESQRVGFHCRSWVIWYYTFGVNCVNGFSRSHTHLFHFVKDPRRFTFNRTNPQIRVKSARQLVYADLRANPDGRLPDNTWITRPQDAPDAFSPMHDTWYFARVAGTFKEREGFHGCQMPEQLLARIIRASSQPQDLVLDPFGGSGTTLCVAKKLGRRWMGFELSEDYVRYIDERLRKTHVDDPIDGPEDPIASAPATAAGKRRKKPMSREMEQAVISAFQELEFPADTVLCDPELNRKFVSLCDQRVSTGNAQFWNRTLLKLRKMGQLPKSKRASPRLNPEYVNRFSFASEVAWRLLAIDYQKTLDEILCSPDFAAEFDRLAAEFGPRDIEVTPFEYRMAALSIRKRSHVARETAAEQFSEWMDRRKRLSQISLNDPLDSLDGPGVFLLGNEDAVFFAGESNNMRDHVERLLKNPNWASLGADRVHFVSQATSLANMFALKSALAIRETPLLNCRLLMHDAELPRATR